MSFTHILLMLLLDCIILNRNYREVLIQYYKKMFLEFQQKHIFLWNENRLFNFETDNLTRRIFSRDQKSSLAPPSSDEEGENHDEEHQANKHAQQEIITISGRTLRRGGDVRMHKAVAARLENPTITLMEALVSGGFRFPTTDCDEDKKVASSLLGSIDRKVLLDEDGVQLCQRKNQLSRRLRIIRKKEENDTGRITTMSATDINWT